MITVNIGKTFLKAYNQAYQKDYSEKEFFEKEYFELFFNHEKYLQWAVNSPFVQSVSSSKTGRYGLSETMKDTEGNTVKFETDEALNTFISEKIDTRNDILEIKSATKKSVKILKLLDENERRKKLNEFQEKVMQSCKEGAVDASIALGFPASEEKEFATTSGLVNIENKQTKEEEVYLSWIGAGLAVGVSGGLSLLFNKGEILLKVFEGWKVYRDLLNNPSLEHLAPNKIVSWNGQWLNYAFSKRFRQNFDFNTLNNRGFFKVTNAGTVINTVKWSELFFSLSNQFPNQTEMVYIFSLGQMNKTLGFYPFRFQQATKLIGYYKLLFGENAVLKDTASFEKLYGIHIKRACELGAIGLQALEPEGLKKYFDKDKMPNFKQVKPAIKKGFTNEEVQQAEQDAKQKDYNKNIVPFRTYKTWLLAMVTKNKEEMIDYTSDIAKALHGCRAENKKASTKIANEIKQLLASSSKTNFISYLTDFINNESVPVEKLETFKELKNRVHLMNAEDFKYLLTLIKFDYAFQNRIA